jgi:hypothetical protein
METDQIQKKAVLASSPSSDKFYTTGSMGQKWLRKSQALR